LRAGWQEDSLRIGKQEDFLGKEISRIEMQEEAEVQRQGI